MSEFFNALNDKPQINMCVKMRCPVCGHNYSHVFCRSIETGTRSNGIEVAINYECGHSFSMIFAEHKGEVVLKTSILGGQYNGD